MELTCSTCACLVLSSTDIHSRLRQAAGTWASMLVMQTQASEQDM